LGAVEHAPVVPHDQIANRPVVDVHARGLAGPRQEVIEQGCRLLVPESRDAMRVPADEERPSARGGMHLYKGSERLDFHVVAVRAVDQVLAGAELGVHDRVEGAEPIDPNSSGGVEGVVGGAHVGPLGRAASRRDDVGDSIEALAEIGM